MARSAWWLFMLHTIMVLCFRLLLCSMCWRIVFINKPSWLIFPTVGSVTCMLPSQSPRIGSRRLKALSGLRIWRKWSVNTKHMKTFRRSTSTFLIAHIRIPASLFLFRTSIRRSLLVVTRYGTLSVSMLMMHTTSPLWRIVLALLMQ